MQAQNRFLNYLNDPSFEGVDRLFSHLKMKMIKKSYKRYYLPTVKIDNVESCSHISAAN